MLRIALLLMTLATPALSRPLSEAEQTSLEAQLQAFSAAMAARDWQAIGDTIPPRVLAVMAEGDVTADQLRVLMVQDMSHQMMTVQVDHATFRAEGLDANDGEVDGAAVVQTFVPFDWAFTWRGQALEGTSPTLALFEDGVWSLLRIESPDQRALVDQAYPFLQDVTFPQ